MISIKFAAQTVKATQENNSESSPSESLGSNKIFPETGLAEPSQSVVNFKKPKQVQDVVLFRGVWSVGKTRVNDSTVVGAKKDST